MSDIKLTELGGRLVQEPEVCVYDGQVVTVSVNVDFVFDHYYAFMNNNLIGKFRAERFGIHSSKFHDGENNLQIDFFDESNKPINSYHVSVYKRKNKRGAENIEQEYTYFHNKLTALEAKIEGIIKWKEEIDSERSGY